MSVFFMAEFLKDTFLTAVVVIPATALWIETERVWIALTTAGILYLAFVHGIPFAVRLRSVEIQDYVGAWRKPVSRQTARRV